MKKVLQLLTIINVFEKIIDECIFKQKKIWADKGNEFYNWSMKSWLPDYG